MKKVLFILLTGSLLLGCDQTPEKVEQAALLTAMILGDMDQGVYRECPGRVSAAQKIDMAFEVSGRVIELPAKEGNSVQKGDLLAVIDPSDYQQAFNQEQARYEIAKATYNRYYKLMKSGTLSQAEFDEKETAYKVAQANLATALKKIPGHI